MNGLFTIMALWLLVMGQGFLWSGRYLYRHGHRPRRDVIANARAAIDGSRQHCVLFLITAGVFWVMGKPPWACLMGACASGVNWIRFKGFVDDLQTPTDSPPPTPPAE